MFQKLCLLPVPGTVHLQYRSLGIQALGPHMCHEQSVLEPHFISNWGSFPLSLVSVHTSVLGLQLLGGFCEKSPTKNEGVFQGFPRASSLPSQTTWGTLFGLGSGFAYVLGSKDSTPFEVGTGVSASSTPILSACLDGSPIDHRGPR